MPEAAKDPALTMTGPEQESRLVNGRRHSGARWNLLANQVLWAVAGAESGRPGIAEVVESAVLTAVARSAQRAYDDTDDQSLGQ
ncbi:alkaline phosphatase D family protein [Actinoplanes sp. NPDC048796]|uniref:alkaline phosphatase D family protein n=1 Tax=unclassified Actinoplanes TaxID=2626549 RepID=UPI0033C24F82